MPAEPGSVLDHHALQQLALIASRAQSIVVSTGAGVSAESGIPTFRDAQTGLWAKYDPVMLASLEGFRSDPANVWHWYDERRVQMAQAQPNAGHMALAQWEALWKSLGRSLTVVTQNIDGLHQRAGSSELLELHGNIWRVRPLDGAYHEAVELRESPLSETPPHDASGRLLRPHVVWFGEMLDPSTLDTALARSSACELLLVAGSSSVVYPAAALPYAALRSGATVAEVNPSATELSADAHFTLRGKSGEVLPLLLSAVRAILESTIG